MLYLFYKAYPVEDSGGFLFLIFLLFHNNTEKHNLNTHTTHTKQNTGIHKKTPKHTHVNIQTQNHTHMTNKQ